MLDGVLWVMKTGAPWRDIPDRFGPWKTVYDRLRRWRADGTLDRVVARLQPDLDREGFIQRSASLCWSAFCIDTTPIRASRAAAGAQKRGAQPPRPLERVSQRIMRWGGRVAVLRASFTS